ncbi:thiol-disulfide isomerase/thioredoxin [Pedobacter sp. AK017]|uniref:TlpA family protein disulfide reductase n=1 Tax=Pedobacter sp. AK017 TaxID=2723073 RepID=UPI00161F656A|nr:TlpA disulfide reductase family protein [Pedobacter sp. AK017]MBB5438898.1 thiol-disulfide isomerase/thioredoxin [Pedobacter sp. AK017]
MKLIKKLFLPFILALCHLFSNVHAQAPTMIKHLKIGDQLPDIEITNFMNSTIVKAKVSDFKGKILLLDFWHSGCSSCIDAFPKMDSLQKIYSGKLQIFLVNPKSLKDTERNVKIVVNRINSWTGTPFILPILFPDTAISENFDIRSFPAVAWIGPEGRVLAITGSSEVTGENISNAIKGLPIATSFHSVK